MPMEYNREDPARANSRPETPEHSRFCQCEPCKDARFDQWAIEAEQGLRCRVCLVPAELDVHLRYCKESQS